MQGPSLFLCLTASLLAGAVSACEPKLVVGEYACPVDGGVEPMPNLTEAITVPWQTSFERGFCDYLRLSGFCYQPDTFEITSAQAHSGHYSAAFRVVSNNADANQSRCVRQGIFPKQVYLSAWYFIPAPASNRGNWNLFHYRAGTTAPTDGLWDISIATATNGELGLYIRKGGETKGIGETPPIPIGVWFQVEVFFRRAADDTGELTLYQDGQKIASITGESTDTFTWGQWYVGNLSDGLMPNDFTLYVDDVSIRETP
ncbi:MAG TPA: LamG-like jellyroll fold domain-containing protein [Polyangiaceae bacterium]|nr:LamG-like jellyroll fold domain-containing protein [Polyangiaceae bacterium]